MSPNLQQKAVSATFWSGVDTFARQGLQFGITVVLARLLSPTDYGTVALLAIFIEVAWSFIQSGLPSALIQRKDVSETDLSSVFFFNLGMSVVVAALLCLASPWIAAFYGVGVLKPLTWLLAANLVVGALGSVQQVLLTRALNFRRQCGISLLAVFISGLVAIVLAWRGYGVWSLGVQTLTAAGITTMMLWTLSAWRPRLRFSLAAIRSLFRFGGFLLLSGLLNTLFSRLYTLLIGKFYSARDLGYYARADSTSLVPGSLMSTVIARVAFPLFAAVQDDKALLQKGLKKAITLVMMVNIPAMLGMAVTARPLVLVLFGDQWLPCVPYLQILCLRGMFWPLHILNLNILIAQGHSHLFFRLEIIKKIIGVLLLGTACFFGITAIAWSSLLTAVLSFVVNAQFSKRLLAYGVAAQLRDLASYFLCGILMTICIWAVSCLPTRREVLLLSLQIICGTTIYFGLCAAFRLPAFVVACNIAREYRRKLAVRRPILGPGLQVSQPRLVADVEQPPEEKAL